MADGNASLMREALKGMLSALADMGFAPFREGDHLLVAIHRANAALAAPPRNCDVGTPEKQSVRMAEFCRTQYEKSDGVLLCSGCRFHNLEGLDCQFAWAQMPYEEGGAK